MKKNGNYLLTQCQLYYPLINHGNSANTKYLKIMTTKSYTSILPSLTSNGITVPHKMIVEFADQLNSRGVEETYYYVSPCWIKYSGISFDAFFEMYDSHYHFDDNEFIIEKDAFQHLLKAMLDRDNTGRGEFPILITKELKPWDNYSLFRDSSVVPANAWREYSTKGKSMKALADAALGQSHIW
jgi:hypothetical protein